MSGLQRFEQRLEQFVSGAFAPLASMPGWMRTMAAFNPVAHATDALRGSVLGTATVTGVVVAIATASALWAVVTLMPSGLRRPSSATKPTESGGHEPPASVGA